MDEPAFAALTGDLVASKDTDPKRRAEVQRHLLAVLDDLGRELRSALARPLIVTAGDEVQGLFRRPSCVVQTVQAITDRLQGSAGGPPIVFGVGWGSLSTGLMPEAKSVEQLDGPCFHLAREALGRAKKSKAWVVYRGFGAPWDEALTSLFELMGELRGRWTAIQSTYTVATRERGKRVDVAKLFDKSPSVITESLQAASFDAIVRGEQAARGLLAPFDPAAGE